MAKRGGQVHSSAMSKREALETLKRMTSHSRYRWSLSQNEGIRDGEEGA
jgi:hypothetical protein